MNPYPPLKALVAFDAAMRTGSFSLAAAELFVTPGAVGQQIQKLEEWLGVALFVRRPRGLEITSEGEALLPDLRDAFDRMTNALERVGRKANSGTLNVSLVTTFALGWLVPRLHRFQAKHPEIEVRVSTSQKTIDFTREDYDAAIRLGRGDWRGRCCTPPNGGCWTRRRGCGGSVRCHPGSAWRSRRTPTAHGSHVATI